MAEWGHLLGKSNHQSTVFSLLKVSTLDVATILSITPFQLVNEKCSKYRKSDHKCSEHSEEIHF